MREWWRRRHDEGGDREARQGCLGPRAMFHMAASATPQEVLLHHWHVQQTSGEGMSKRRTPNSILQTFNRSTFPAYLDVAERVRVHLEARK